MVDQKKIIDFLKELGFKKARENKDKDGRHIVFEKMLKTDISISTCRIHLSFWLGWKPSLSIKQEWKFTKETYHCNIAERYQFTSFRQFKYLVTGSTRMRNFIKKKLYKEE